MKPKITARDFDRAFDEGQDITPHLDVNKADRPGQSPRRVNVDFPTWMVAGPDTRAAHPGRHHPPGPHQTLDRGAAGVMPLRARSNILAMPGGMHVEWFESNFEDCEEDKIRRLGPDAVEPKRIEYKKFAR